MRIESLILKKKQRYQGTVHLKKDVRFFDYVSLMQFKVFIFKLPEDILLGFCIHLKCVL